MNTLHRCTCGTSLRIPPALQGKSVRCPRCKATMPTMQAAVANADAPTEKPIVPPAAEPMSGGDGQAFAAGESESSLTCPICLSQVEREQLVHRCSGCDIVHHEECWLEIGGCSTFGCKKAPAIDKAEQAGQEPLTAWGDTKVCPVCCETIKSIALRCRYCNTEFRTVDPQTASDLRNQFEERQQTDQFRVFVIVAFIASLVGLLAPFTLLFGLLYILPRRRLLAKAGPVVQVLGWVSIGLSGLYCLLMLVFFLLSQ